MSDTAVSREEQCRDISERLAAIESMVKRLDRTVSAVDVENLRAILNRIERTLTDMRRESYTRWAHDRSLREHIRRITTIDLQRDR